MERIMKKFMIMLALSTLLVACGKNDSGNGSGSGSNFSVSLTNQGLAIVSSANGFNQFNQNTSNQFGNSFGQVETLVITCQDFFNNNNVTNESRLIALDTLLRQAQREQTVVLNGSRYDSRQIQILIAQAMQSLLGSNNFNNTNGFSVNLNFGIGFNNNNGFSNNGLNNFSSCPSQQLSGVQVQRLQ